MKNPDEIQAKTCCNTKWTDVMKSIAGPYLIVTYI